MKEKTIEELTEEFLAKGGEVEILPTEEPIIKKPVIGSLNKKIPVLKTLPEAELMYGKKQVKKKKKKIPDYSSINMDLIPDHLKELLKINDNKADDPSSTKEKS